QAEDPLLGAEHTALVFLQLRRHVALGADERLASHVLRWHLARVRIAHLDRVTEDPVEADAETADSRALALALLERRDPLPRVSSRLLQLAKLGIPTISHQPPFPHPPRCPLPH